MAYSRSSVTDENLSVYRGPYIGAHVLLNLLNELGKRDFSQRVLINSIIHEHECYLFAQSRHSPESSLVRYT